MPKQTFFNLPDAKRRAVFDAAVGEFAQNRFSEASINQIIKTAKIPRGSFYQYFADKEDVYLYMLGEINAQLSQSERIVSVHSAQEQGDALSAFLQRMVATIALNTTHPAYNRIALLLEHDDSPVTARLKSASEMDLKRVASLIEADKQRGLVREDVDAMLLTDMVHALATKEFFRAEGDVQQFERRMRAIVEMIRHGIERSGES